MGLRKIIRKALYNLKYTKKKSNSVSGKNFLIKELFPAPSGPNTTIKNKFLQNKNFLIFFI